MHKITIQHREIGAGYPCFIIAEVGLNHNGDPRLAIQLIQEAARCGADAVKFQTYTPSELFPSDHPEYKKFEQHVFSFQQYEQFMQEAARQKIVFLSTPFDEASADLLDALNVAAFKIGSGELTHLRLLRYIAQKEKPLIVSTGMSTTDQIDRAIHTIQSTGNSQWALLHCVSAYPCPLEEANVRQVTCLKESYSCPVGFSDHTETNTAAMAAVSLGACIVEKHFTLSHDLPGWDHHFSFDPPQMTSFIRSIREVETVLGTAEKKLMPHEKPVQKIARRSIYARQAIPKGSVLTLENVMVRRPEGPMSADEFQTILGKTVKRDINEGEPLRREDIKNLP